MRKILLMAALVGLAMNADAAKVKKARAAKKAPVETVARVAAPTMTEIDDMDVNNVNRLPVHTTFFAYENEALALKGDMTKSSRFLSLHGNWKFNWVANRDERPADFYKTDLDDSKWGTMPVPGMWELNGY